MFVNVTLLTVMVEFAGLLPYTLFVGGCCKIPFFWKFTQMNQPGIFSPNCQSYINSVIYLHELLVVASFPDREPTSLSDSSGALVSGVLFALCLYRFRSVCSVSSALVPSYLFSRSIPVITWHASWTGILERVRDIPGQYLRPSDQPARCHQSLPALFFPSELQDRDC